MKLTRHEIVLVLGLLAALVTGGLVKRFREVHPAPLPVTKPISKK